MDVGTVAVCVVTHNSEGDLRGCLDSIAALRYRPLELVVVDCASTDDSVATVSRHHQPELPLVHRALSENIGFAGGMNEALAQTDAPWVLTLNPDARPDPDYISHLLERATRHPEFRVGALAGRLVRPQQADETRLLDACGMFLSPTWRHFDRGSGEPATGSWTRADRVFGATGAASLFRREALDDVAVEREMFLSEFHSFREDAELCFRLQERGWEVLYEPSALCEHRRHNLPSRRRQMPPHVNMHSLKNRYLLRLYHQNGMNLLLTGVPALLRDLAAFAYVLLRERSSLGAYGWLWQHRREILRRRKAIRGRRTVTSSTINRWFFQKGLSL
ncbi:MAG: glycosyltransferase [Nitrospirae bacterium]|nr:glycosyltransferase [Nitrospirota bacterium]